MTPQTEDPHRRSLLKLGLAGGVLLSSGGIGWVGLRATKLGPAPQSPLRAFDLQEFAVMSAIAACIMPSTAEGRQHKDQSQPLWPSANNLQCAEKVDAVVASLHPEAAAEFKQLLGLFENGISGLLTNGRPTPFTRLTGPLQSARLNAWRRSRISLLRSGYLALTRLVHATYYSSPQVYASMGYPGPPEVPFARDTEGDMPLGFKP